MPFGLSPRLLLELPGVLNWAIEGWHRLRARGYFTVPKSSGENTEQLADLGSPIGSFVRERCEVAPGGRVAVQDVYAAWRDWCREQGIERITVKEHFGRDLRAYVPSITRGQARAAGGREPVYSGLALRPNARPPGIAWSGGVPPPPPA